MPTILAIATGILIGFVSVPYLFAIFGIRLEDVPSEVSEAVHGLSDSAGEAQNHVI